MTWFRINGHQLFFLFAYPFVPIGGLQVAYGISVIFHEITLQKVFVACWSWLCGNLQSVGFGFGSSLGFTVILSWITLQKVNWIAWTCSSNQLYNLEDDVRDLPLAVETSCYLIGFVCPSWCNSDVLLANYRWRPDLCRLCVHAYYPRRSPNGCNYPLRRIGSSFERTKWLDRMLS